MDEGSKPPGKTDVDWRDYKARSDALAHAVSLAHTVSETTDDTVANAAKFYSFLRGDS